MDKFQLGGTLDRHATPALGPSPTNRAMSPDIGPYGPRAADNNAKGARWVIEPAPTTARTTSDDGAVPPTYTSEGRQRRAPRVIGTSVTYAAVVKTIARSSGML
jgi:hypothetical protein